MTKLERTIKGIELCCNHPATEACAECPYDEFYPKCLSAKEIEILEILKQFQPRVMTLEELEKHCAEEIPFTFSENAPVYIEYCIERPWNIRWGTAETIRSWLGDVGVYNDYGKEWRCWTARPTDEQREAVKWDE